MTTPLSASPSTELCHCGHTDDQHDDVAKRYCQATLTAALPRGCTCPTGPRVPPRSYDRR